MCYLPTWPSFLRTQATLCRPIVLLILPCRWRDPATYVCTSISVEEGFFELLPLTVRPTGSPIYMDEQDKDRLDKNNEDSAGRGEGTSARGALSTFSTWTSARSARAKDKEPDLSQAQHEFPIM